MNRSLDIVIVNWNAGRYLGDCLDCVRATRRDGFELKRVVVVDNASSDGSADNLHSSELPLSVLRNTENLGFAAACNEGAQGSAADYLLFLNPDMRVLVDSLETPIRFMEEPGNREVGICGIQLLDEGGNVSQSCSRFPTAASLFFQMIGLDRFFPSLFEGHFYDQQHHLKSGQVDQVMGAFFLVRHESFEALGGFDERFFVYFEDLDFSHRANQAGWQSYHLATAKAQHRGGGCSEQVKARRLYYSLTSRILYAYKHFDRMAATGVMLGTLLVEPLSRLVLGAVHKSVREIRETIGAYTMLWSSLPSLLTSHRGAVKQREPSPEPVGSVPGK